MLTTTTSVLLGLGLAASCGLRTFLPLLALGLAARFHIAGVSVNDHLAWVASTPSLITLGCAAIAEFAADKVPIVDHGLHLIGAVTRPAAGALAVAAASQHIDPGTAALIGLMLGAPTAFGVHTAVAGTRLASTVATAGLANPLVSSVEDVLALGGAVLAILVPLLVPLLLALAVLLIWRRRRRQAI